MVGWSVGRIGLDGLCGGWQKVKRRNNIMRTLPGGSNYLLRRDGDSDRDSASG